MGAAVRRAKVAVSVVFALNGLAVATWFARIPAARDALGLSAAGSGCCCSPCPAARCWRCPPPAWWPGGSARPAPSPSPRRLVAAGLTCRVGPPGRRPGRWRSGCVALGYGSGICDVAMNVEGAAVERRLGRTVMPRFHAGWSLGTVAGAALGRRRRPRSACRSPCTWPRGAVVLSARCWPPVAPAGGRGEPPPAAPAAPAERRRGCSPPGGSRVPCSSACWCW